MSLTSRALRLAVLVPIGLAASCFRVTAPEDPSPVVYPALVSVRVEYRQPNGCVDTTIGCDQGPVTFYGSWMNPHGTHVLLTRLAGTFIWTGTVQNVPANFPPADQPYLVRVVDPYLKDTPTGGPTADRLRVGGQLLTKFYEYGTPDESGLIYIDAQGVGHSPF